MDKIKVGQVWKQNKSGFLGVVNRVEKESNSVWIKFYLGFGIAPFVRHFVYGTFSMEFTETELCFTRVTFKEYEGEITAFLWDCSANKDIVLSYAHVGQHCYAGEAFYNMSNEVSNQQDKIALLNELESIGYFVVEVEDTPEDFSWSEMKE